MELAVHPFTVRKWVPLTISRGTTATSTNLWLRLSADGIEGWGEATPFSIGTHQQTTEELQSQLEALQPQLASFHPLQRQAIASLDGVRGMASAARAALDVALLDWLGKATAQPCWQLLGLDLAQMPPTSGTIGISSPAAACDRLATWLNDHHLHAIKLKLGSPAGAEADRAMVAAVQAACPASVNLSVDANGGWDLPTAQAMAPWLAERGVTYLEQPLPPTKTQDLATLRRQSPLPIFLDESCFRSTDIPALATLGHGINIKLMKAGGISEALRMIHTARACGLQVMFGCYSDSALANTALVHLAPLADHLDLDSHLNLKDDPFTGATLIDGHLTPNAHPGFGLTYASPH